MKYHGSLAQLVEQQPFKLMVAGSIPARPKVSKWERGRENGSFPVAEELKPRGFRERSDVRSLHDPKNRISNFLLWAISSAG